MGIGTSLPRNQFFLNATALLAAILVAAWFFYLLMLSGAAWLHPEALAGSVYVWLHPGQESFLRMFRKIFDWKAFDPNVNRVRPLNDIVEVIDAMARPYVTMLVGVQPSLNISTVATALLAPSFFFAWARRTLIYWIPALMLALVFVSSIGFLSLTISYIHPAKRINLVLLCATLLFARRAEQKASPNEFWWMYLCLFASFFSDELALANFLIIGLIYWQTIARRKQHLFAFLLLPVLFIAVTKWGLPTIYRFMSAHDAWDALADPKKFAVFAYLFTWEFHLAALTQLGRSILSTFGMSTHTPATESLAILGVIAGTALAAVRSGVRSLGDVMASKVVLAAVSLAAASWFATLLDWYPFPHEISYMGSFNYYYHSSIVIPVLVWLAFLLRALLPSPSTIKMAALMAGAVLVVVANFMMFASVNALVIAIHYHPYPPLTLFAAVGEVSRLPRGSRTDVVIQADPAGESRKFEAALRALFGERWQQNGFYKTHKMLEGTSIMSDAHIGHLLKSYRPWVVAVPGIIRPH